MSAARKARQAAQEAALFRNLEKLAGPTPVTAVEAEAKTPLEQQEYSSQGGLLASDSDSDSPMSEPTEAEVMAILRAQEKARKEKLKKQRKKKKKPQQQQQKKKQQKQKKQQPEENMAAIMKSLGVDAKQAAQQQVEQAQKGPEVNLAPLHMDPAQYNPSAEIKQRFGKHAARSSNKQKAAQRRPEEPSYRMTPGMARGARRTNGGRLLQSKRKKKKQGGDRGVPHALVFSQSSQALPQHFKHNVVRRMGVTFRKKYKSAWFSFQPTDMYLAMEHEYKVVQATMNPQNLITFVRQYPHHVDGLLQLSYILECQSDFSSAHDLVMQALSLYQACFHYDFDVSSGAVHMDHSQSAYDMSFMRAVAKHIQFLGKKGCTRTALELCKFLYSLSPVVDPCNMICFLDFYALRSSQYAFLREFMGLLDRMAVNRPNLLYSTALATFYEEKAGSFTPVEPEPEQKFHPDDVFAIDTNAAIRLEGALLMFPEVLEPLLKAVNEYEFKKGIWVKTVLPALNKLISRYKAISNYETHPVVAKLVKVFVARSSMLYNDSDALDWLQTIAVQIAKNLTAETYDVEALLSLRQQHYPAEIKDLTLAMMERHDYTDDVPQLPAELLANAQGQHGNGQQPHGMPQVPEENILPLDANPIQLLFQSLLPWMQVDPHLQMNENQNGVDMPGLANMLEQLQVAFALDQDNNVDPDDVKTEDLD